METYADGCEHSCSGSCRNEGCNCECGEWHGKYEEDQIADAVQKLEDQGNDVNSKGILE